MRQRVRVVGMIKRGDSVLVAKKQRGRLASDFSVWEIPTGKIQFGEQPEEAVSRFVLDYLGVVAEKIILKDAVTFLSLSGSSQLNNLYIIYEIIVRSDCKIRPRDRYSAYKFFNGDASQKNIRLNEASSIILGLENENSFVLGSSMRSVANGATIYVDGCSRGNPGPSGVGYVITDGDNQVIKRGGEFIGFATSRVAEYRALKIGCDQAIKMGIKNVKIVSDSLMMINQMNGIYRIKNEDLVPIYNDICDGLKKFDAYAFMYVDRELNQEADREANIAVDRQFERDVVE